MATRDEILEKIARMERELEADIREFYARTLPEARQAIEDAGCLEFDNAVDGLRRLHQAKALIGAICGNKFNCGFRSVEVVQDEAKHEIEKMLKRIDSKIDQICREQAMAELPPGSKLIQKRANEIGGEAYAELRRQDRVANRVINRINDKLESDTEGQE